MIICVWSEFLGAVLWQVSWVVEGPIHNLFDYSAYWKELLAARSVFWCKLGFIQSPAKCLLEVPAPFRNSFQGQLPIFLQAGIFLQQQQYPVPHRLPHRTGSGKNKREGDRAADTFSHCLFMLQPTSWISWCFSKVCTSRGVSTWCLLVTHSVDNVDMMVLEHWFSFARCFKSQV